jgi:hypothetical protein
MKLPRDRSAGVLLVELSSSPEQGGSCYFRLWSDGAYEIAPEASAAQLRYVIDMLCTGPMRDRTQLTCQPG